MRLTQKILVLLITISVFGCSAYKAKKQEALLVLPELGTLVQTKGDISYQAAQQIGQPDWGTLKVDIQQLPFNIESYVSYAKHIQRAGKINSIPYNDSLRYKPKYIRLKLSNTIKLTKLLNSDKINQIRQYLSQDKDHRMVTAIDVALTESEVENFLGAKGAQLGKDKLDNVILVVFYKNQKNTYLLKDLPVFNYTLSTFCWGEDQYHNARIENIRTDDLKCPKNTYSNASKIKSDKSYLKF